MTNVLRTTNPDLSAARTKLVDHVRDQASWRAEKAEGYPEDARNERSARGLAALAEYIETLPDADQRLVRVLQLEPLPNDDSIPWMGGGEEANQALGQFRFHMAGEPFESFLERYAEAAERDIEADESER